MAIDSTAQMRNRSAIAPASDSEDSVRAHMVVSTREVVVAAMSWQSFPPRGHAIFM